MSEYLVPLVNNGIFNSSDFNYQDKSVTLKDLNIILDDYDANDVSHSNSIATNTTKLTDITYGSSITTVANQLTINKLNANAYTCPLNTTSNLIIGNSSANIAGAPTITNSVILGSDNCDNIDTLTSSVIIGNGCNIASGTNLNCVSIGFQANENNVGNNNVGIGNNTARYNIGTSNVCVGVWAGQGTTGVSDYDDCVIIGKSAVKILSKFFEWIKKYKK